MARKHYRENPPEAQPKTPKEKWDNFWYYHKWHLVIGAVAAVLVIYFVHDMVTKTEPDISVTLVSDKTVLTTVGQGFLESDLAAMSEDVNGSGKEAHVDALEFDDASTEQVLRMKLMTDLQDSYPIFIMDQTNYDSLKKEGVFRKVSEVAPNAQTMSDGLAVPVEDTTLAASSQYGKQLTGMVVGLRGYEGTFKKIMTQKEYDNAVQIFKKIVTPASSSTASK